MRALAPRQLELLRSIAAFIDEHRYPPSYREMCVAIGVASTNTVAGILDRLIAKGAIWRCPVRSRSMRITELGHAALRGEPAA